MHIETIKIENLRNIANAELSPHKKINIIVGCNGAGKTTLLESIYLLARARTFRQQKTGRLIREGEEQLSLFTSFQTATNNRHHIGLRKTVSGTVIRKDGKNLKKRSDLAKSIPLSIITPNIQRIIEDDPNNRRRLLNWGMFHVEHEYAYLANRYKKTLIQRNNALRGSREQIKVWDRQLIQLGNEIDRRMSRYTKIWNDTLNALIDVTGLIKPISLEVKQGWKEELSFAEAIDRNSKIDKERGFTSCGPHRSDLKILQDGKPIKNIFSRGEAKIAAVIMLLSQTKILEDRTGESPVLLVDDLHSELDNERYAHLLKLIEEMKVQSFATTLDSDRSKNLLSADACQWFHVEHGDISFLY
ncbi:MAG: DNA replication/repair protein RecF [Candidatus Thiodiazotropha endolucinida]|uniref:DNA replication and repair protein RecF n=1 Tax=Candidatus Thiodiazotropha endolucinida TaxID=1655433 RepID=A0A7Z0VQ21_9GAMM|nr:DNA replication/repair protein RecF [Candidatus Thiodiazotropha endolucinida]ODJ89271.1 DNA replication and repair protein RecF [Candidatus Thiodiazotropha endolucinida]